MNEDVLIRIEQKIDETVSNRDEICQLADQLCGTGAHKPFALGVVVGRVYNSFYYQSKRILGREPTREEFKEFLALLASKKSVLGCDW